MADYRFKFIKFVKPEHLAFNPSSNVAGSVQKQSDPLRLVGQDRQLLAIPEQEAHLYEQFKHITVEPSSNVDVPEHAQFDPERPVGQDEQLVAITEQVAHLYEQL